MKISKMIIAWVLISMGIMCCTTIASNKKESEKSSILDTSSNTPVQEKMDRIVFNSSEKIEIISLMKTNNYPSSLKDTSICMNWKLNKQNLPDILKSFVKISSPEWHYSYDHLPCAYQGKLMYKGNTYTFDINGGSWLSINYPDSVIRYGCRDSSCIDFFLSQPIEE